MIYAHMKTNPDYSKTVFETCENCVYNSTGDTTGTRTIGHPKCDPCRRYSNFAYKEKNPLYKSPFPHLKDSKDGINWEVKGVSVVTPEQITNLFGNKERPAHYQNNWDVARFADNRKYDLYQFNILKYVDRHERKDGKKALLKALDYLQEYINVRYPEEK